MRSTFDLLLEKILSERGPIGDIGISDVKSYNDAMAKSLLDKLFFLNDDIKYGNGKVILIDFGCANDKMLNAINTKIDGRLNLGINNVVKMIGYDLDPEMVKMAEVENQKFSDVTEFTTRWKAIEKWLRKYNPNKEYTTIVSLSSVLHEVYSYAKSPAVIEQFWKDITSDLFDYIVIRDMAVPEYATAQESDINDVKKIEAWVAKQGMDKYLSEFERNFGSIEILKNMLHYLLKYTYTENWEREVRENYLPISSDKIKSKLVSAGFKIVSWQEYPLTYIARKVLTDFKIKFDVPTHLKLIATNKNVKHEFRKLKEKRMVRS
jgi:hypothetical protein